MLDIAYSCYCAHSELSDIEVKDTEIEMPVLFCLKKNKVSLC